MTKGLEIPSQWNTIETFKVSELKDKFEIKVTPEELKKYGDTLLNMSEIQKIKEGTSTITQLGLEKLKRSVDNTSNAINQFKEDFKPKEVMERSQNWLDDISKKLDSAFDHVEWEVKQDIKTWVKKATEVWKKLQKWWYSVQLWEALNDAFSKLKNFDIFWALISLFKWLFWMFVWNEALKKAWDKAKEKITEALNPSQIEATKNNIKATLLSTFPEKEEYIDSILNDPKKLTKEKIDYFYGKIKKWETITLSDLQKEFTDLDITNLLTEKAEEYKKSLIIKIKKNLEIKYNKTLTTEQAQDLWKLISKYLTIDGSNIEKIQSKINIDHELQLKDIMPIILEWWKNSIWFMFWLVSANIISISDIAMNFAEKWWEIITLSLSALWLSETVNIDDLYESISEMNEKDKAILIALLYRKGWLFLNILWSLSSLSSKLLIETILPTNSWVDWIKLLKDSLLHWNIKQIENFSKIEKALSWSKETLEWAKYLKEALSNLAEVKKNFAILEIMKKSDWDLTKFYKEIADFENSTNIKLKVEKYSDFDSLKNWLSNKMKNWFASKHNFDFRDLKNKWLWFWIESALQDFNKNLEKIWASQARIALWRLNLNPFKKISESIDISKVSKLWDSLLFELRSPNDAKAFLKQMNELAKKSPELIKGIFDKLPIIAIWGLAATSEEPFFESLKNELPYLLPVIWPIMMISNAWINWKTMPPTFMKADQAVIAWWLLTLDWYFFLNEKWAINKFKYLGKPIKDIYDMWKGTITIWQRLYKTWSVFENWKTAKSVFKSALSKTKSLKWKIKALAIIALVWYWTLELAFADNNNELSEYIKDWKLDLTKIKKDADSLSNKEKNDIIKIVLLEHSWKEILKNIKYNINNDILEINSQNNKYQWLFFINNETKQILFDLFWIKDYKFNYKKPE